MMQILSTELLWTTACNWFFSGDLIPYFSFSDMCGKDIQTFPFK